MGKRYLIEWNPLARLDLLNIVNYIGKDSYPRAEQFANAICDKINLLIELPLLGRLSDIENIRELVVHRNYIVIYKIQDHAVEILRIKHAALED